MPASPAVSGPVKPSLVKPSLTLKRRLNASPEKVYAAWTDPAHLTKWFGPEGGVVERAELNATPGGRYLIAFHTPDGEHHQIGGIYKEVVRNEKLSFTWAWRTMPERESFVTVTIKPEGAGCILTLLHEQFFDEPARDRHEWGWTGALNKLEKMFA